MKTRILLPLAILAVLISLLISLKTKEQGTKVENKTQIEETVSTAKPLIIADGKEIAYDDFLKINPEEIFSITVLKDKAATELYGEKGQNGVIILEL